MFSVSLPRAGDYVLTLIPNMSTDLFPFRFGLYLPIYGNVSTDGLRPHSFGRDQFNNSSCIHYNVEGNLFCSLVGGNITQQSGPLYYPAPVNGSQKVPFGDQWLGGAYPFNATMHAIVPSGSSHDSQVTFYRPLTYYWDECWYRAKLVSVSSNCYRVEYRARRTRLDNGQVYYSHLYVHYIEFSNGYLKYRLKSLPGDVSIGADVKGVAPWVDLKSIGWSTISSGYRITLTGSAPNVPQVKASEIFRRLTKSHEYIVSNDSSSFGELSVSAVQSLKVFDGQLSLYFRDFLTFQGMFTEAAKLLKGVTLKGLSSAYLSYHYGLRLTYKDTVDLLTSSRRLVDGAKGYNSSRARLSKSLTSKIGVKNLVWKCEYNMKLYVQDYPEFVIKALNMLMAADFFPTMELVWDVIPFSFVVDWLLPIGNALETIDSNTLLSTYHVLSCVFSRKAVCRIRLTDIFPELNGLIAGDVVISDYVRHVTSVPPPFVVDFSTPRTFNHWLEGAALIAQRSRL